METKQNESNTKKQKHIEASHILLVGIIGGILLGACLAAITHNPFPQVGIGLAVGIIVAAFVIALRKKNEHP